MPFEIFRRRDVSQTRPPVGEVSQKLSEDLKELEKLGNVESGVNVGDASETVEPPTHTSVSQEIQKQSRIVAQVFASVADAAAADDRSSASRPPATGAGYSTVETRTNGTSGATTAGPIPGADEARELLMQLLALDVPTRLVSSLGSLDFEVRKDVINVFSEVIRVGTLFGADLELAEYVRKQPRFYEILVGGYDRPEVSTQCGVILRSCARHKRLTEELFARPEVCLRLLSFTRNESFDISSDAFSTVHDLLLTHKASSAAFLEANFNGFFSKYNGLLQQESDYVTQRQALKLLSEMLLNRTFMRVMLLYVGDEQFLQIHMNLLRANSKAIQFEAFHVFKIFVANPQKPPRVQHILAKNKDRLVSLLDSLRPTRQDDRQYLEDRNTVVEKLKALELPARSSASKATPGASATADSSTAAPESKQTPKSLDAVPQPTGVETR